MKYRKCEICGLKTERKDGQKRYFMAKFPLDEARCRLWVKVTGKEDLAYVPIEKLHDNKFICGKHFTDKDFKKKRTQLKNYAVPSVRLTAPPLPDEILRDFPLHVYRTPSVSDEVCNSGTEASLNIKNNKQNILSGNESIASTYTNTTTSKNVNNNMFMNENKLIATTSKTTSAGDSCTGRIYSEEEIPIEANILEIHTCDSTVASVDRPCNKQSRETSQVEIKTRSSNARKSCKRDTLQVTPRKKKLIKKINKYKILLKQFRKKVKQLESIRSPALKTFLQSSIKNQARNLKGRRWSNNMKGLALAIYKKAPRVYRYLKQLMPLPSERTLQSILQKLPMEPGWNDLVFKYLEKYAKKISDKEKYCVILFDEMSLKKRLFYNPRTDKVEGYVDLGSAGRTSDLADKALVFMLQGVYKKIKQPIGHFFVKGTISSQQLSVFIKEAIKKVSECGYRVLATVCDQGPTNVGALSLLKRFSLLSPDDNFFLVDGQKINIIFDVPHLFKSIRNNFMHAGHIKFNGQLAKWSHIQEICELNTATLHFKKITPLHANPTYKSKMKVKLAAQILSNTVKAILMLRADTYKEDDDGVSKREALLSTANVVHELDLLFDCTNGPSSKDDIKKGIRENVHKNSNHHRLWSEYKTKIKTIEFLTSGSHIRLSNVRCTQGYYITLCSFQDIWKEVSKAGFKYLNLRQLNQDSLENLFGIIRQHCPTNQNPTCHHFTAALKSTILTRLNTPLRGSNCEKDENELILDFHDVVFPNSAPEDLLENEHQYSAAVFDEEEPEDIDAPCLHIPEDQDAISDARSFAEFEKQPLVYVSGYIALAVIKRIHVTCTECLNSLRTNSPGEEEMYRYIALNEWHNKKSLTYPTVKLCSMVEGMVKVFEEEARPLLHQSDIGNICRLSMLRAIDSSWICATHWSEITDQLLMQISLLLIRNDCKEINRTCSEREESCADYIKKAQVMGIRR